MAIDWEYEAWRCAFGNHPGQWPSTTAPTELGPCLTCGNMTYENLVHHCSTAVVTKEDVRAKTLP